MQEYHKIQSLYKRDMQGNRKLLVGQWSVPEFEYLQNNLWVWSEKIDGTNLRIGWRNNSMFIGGRTEKAQIPAELVQRLHEIFPKEKLEERFKELPEDTEAMLFGEGYGRKIQSGGDYIPDGVDVILFDVRIGKWWLRRQDVDKMAEQLGIKSVPIVGQGNIAEAVEFAKSGFESQVSQKMKVAEGLVIRPAVELISRNGQRVIAKVKYKDF